MAESGFTPLECSPWMGQVLSAALGNTADLWPVEWVVAPKARHFQNSTLYAQGLSGQSCHVVTSTQSREDHIVKL